MMRIVILLILFAFTAAAQNIYKPSDEKEIMESFRQHKLMKENSIFKNLEFKNIGPVVMSGRVVDLDVNPEHPEIFYVAYASGGVWRTENNGNTFSPVFDEQASIVIGDIAVDWKNETLWIGTGENNSSRSSYAGAGIYKTTDKGKTFTHCGLVTSGRTGRIILHPDNSDVVWAAMAGNLYSTGGERGLYKSVDGGKSWKRTLFIDDTTGVIDLVIDPKNPNVLYAASWRRFRTAWNFEEGGSQSAVYKSIDGGNTWKKLNNGLPVNNVGRIGLSVSESNPETIYAFVDNQNKRPVKDQAPKKEEGLTVERLKKMSREEFLKLPEDTLKAFLDKNDFPKEYDAPFILNGIKEGKYKISDVIDFVEDAMSQMVNTPIIGAEVYVSTNGGDSWNRTHQDYIDDMYYTYGYFFGQMKVDPNDENKIYIMGVPILVSNDGGKTFKSINEENVHADHHAMWINKKNSNHFILGNDGGVNITYDGGKNYFNLNTPSVGQFYAISYDNDEPYNVYGGLQDNGVWYGPGNNTENHDWFASGNYPYKFLIGGDGMQIAVDTSSENIIYTGYQFGSYYRINKRTEDRKSIQPKPLFGEKPFRFNWQSPILLSNHNNSIIYFGSNKLLRSLNKGDNFEVISPDLTKGSKEGDVPYGTITSISESPLRFGLIYTGSDDGLVYKTNDGGGSWENITNGLPQDLWISRVIASKYDVNLVYVTLNGYRYDHYKSYVYKSTDAGKNWIKIGKDIPDEAVNVLREDPKNSNIIYVGTDRGAYVSLDKGNSFFSFTNGLPNVPVHDLIVHHREDELLLGTHGRSIYKADVKELQQLNETTLAKGIHIFEIQEKKFSKNWGKKFYTWENAEDPSLIIPYYSNKPGVVKIRIKLDDLLINEFEDNAEQGLNYFKYDLSINKKVSEKFEEKLNKGNKKDDYVKLSESDTKKIYLMPDKYTVDIIRGKDKDSKEFRIKK